jgi:hypothetical protein
VQFDDAGTTFRPDPGIDIPIQVSLLGLVLASALIAVLAPLGKLDIPVPPFMRYSLPFLGALIAAMGAPMLWRNVSRGGTTKCLWLTPAGFELSEGLWSHAGGSTPVRNAASDRKMHANRGVSMCRHGRSR